MHISDLQGQNQRKTLSCKLDYLEHILNACKMITVKLSRLLNSHTRPERLQCYECDTVGSRTVISLASQRKRTMEDDLIKIALEAN